MEELRLIIDFSESEGLSAPRDREELIHNAVAHLRTVLSQKQVGLTVVSPYEYAETIANNSRLSDWANEDDADRGVD